MNEQASEAKEGVAGVPQGASPASSEPRESQIAPSGVTGGETTPSQEKPDQSSQAPIPFGDKRHPEYRRFKELTDSNRKYKEQFEQVQREMAELRGFRDSMLAQQRGNDPQIDPQLANQITELFRVGLTLPQVKDTIAKAYGLDRLDKIEKDFGQFKEGWEGSQYEAEMSEVLKSAEKLGLDPDDVKDELSEHVSNHPFFSEKSYYKGGVWAAFRDKYWDRIGELRERAQNKERIEKRDGLKTGQVQATGPASAGQTPLPKGTAASVVEMIRRAGGRDKVDWLG